MKKVLSIVIPFFKESEVQLRPLLSTIATHLQSVEVLMVNDGHEDFNIREEFFEEFPYLNITLLHLTENKGSGVARQVGLENAVGTYVMFCDCDDLLQNVGILGGMLQEMAVSEAEFLSTSWLEECIVENHVTFIPHEQETTWLHGKMFLRSFLVNHNIRFHDKLRVHEDTYFLSILCELAKKKQHLPVTSYIWTYNPDSITRSDDAIYSFNSMGQFVYAVLESVKNLEERGIVETIPYKVTQLLAYIYLIHQSKVWGNPDVGIYRQEMVASLKENMSGLWHYFEEATEDFVAQVYWEEVVKEPRDLAEVSFGDWVMNVKADVV